MTDGYKIINTIYKTTGEAKSFVIWTGCLQDCGQRISAEASEVGIRQPSIGAAFAEDIHLT